MHYPTTPEKQEELSKKVAAVHAQTVMEQIKAMPCTEKTRELVELINEAARLEGFEAGWVDAGGGSDANRIAQAGTPVVDGVAPAGGCFHSEREYLRVDTIESRVRMLTRFLTLL